MSLARRQPLRPPPGRRHRPTFLRRRRPPYVTTAPAVKSVTSALSFSDTELRNPEVKQTATFGQTIVLAELHVTVTTALGLGSKISSDSGDLATDRFRR